MNELWKQYILDSETDTDNFNEEDLDRDDEIIETPLRNFARTRSIISRQNDRIQSKKKGLSRAHSIVYTTNGDEDDGDVDDDHNQRSSSSSFRRRIIATNTHTDDNQFDRNDRDNRKSLLKKTKQFHSLEPNRRKHSRLTNHLEGKKFSPNQIVTLDRNRQWERRKQSLLILHRNNLDYYRSIEIDMMERIRDLQQQQQRFISKTSKSLSNRNDNSVEHQNRKGSGVDVNNHHLHQTSTRIAENIYDTVADDHRDLVYKAPNDLPAMNRSQAVLVQQQTEIEQWLNEMEKKLDSIQIERFQNEISKKKSSKNLPDDHINSKGDVMDRFTESNGNLQHQLETLLVSLIRIFFCVLFVFPIEFD